jgi:addiction module HigA family antidote
MAKAAHSKRLPAMHPGELLREDVVPALGRPRVEIARLLGISRQTLHAILTERAPVTPEMALRLGNCAATDLNYGSICKHAMTLSTWPRQSEQPSMQFRRWRPSRSIYIPNISIGRPKWARATGAAKLRSCDEMWLLYIATSR